MENKKIKIKLKQLFYFGKERIPGSYDCKLDENNFVTLYFQHAKNNFKNKITFKMKHEDYLKYEKVLKNHIDGVFDLTVKTEYKPRNTIILDKSIIIKIEPSKKSGSIHGIQIESAELFQMKGLVKHNETKKLGRKPKQFELLNLLSMESDQLITGIVWGHLVACRKEDGSGYYYNENPAIKKMNGITYETEFRGKLVLREGDWKLYFTDFKYGSVNYDLNVNKTKESKKVMNEQEQLFEEQENECCDSLEYDKLNDVSSDTKEGNYDSLDNEFDLSNDIFGLNDDAFDTSDEIVDLDDEEFALLFNKHSNECGKVGDEA